MFASGNTRYLINNIIPRQMCSKIIITVVKYTMFDLPKVE